MDLFQHINNLTTDKIELDTKNTEDMKTYLPFLINRFISMAELYIPLVNEINKYPDIPKEVHQRFFCTSLSQRKQYFKYISKKKDLDKEKRDCVSKYFEVGTRDVQSAINVLDENQLGNIVNKFQFGKQ